MIDDNDAIKESLERVSDVQSKIKDAIAPMLETQEKLKAITNHLTQTLATYKTSVLFSNPVLEELKQSLRNSALESIKLQLSTPDLDMLKEMNMSLASSLSDSIKSVLERYSSITDSLRTPVLDWLRSFDFSPITDIIKNLQFEPNTSRRYKELNEIYLQTMYETKWFPYAGRIADTSLFREINEIIATSRGASKNREKRIDKAILSYYTNTEIRNIKKSWWNSDLDYCIRKTLSQAIASFLRGEYVLTITCLSTMWEGLIYIKAKDTDTSSRKRQQMNETKKELKELVEYNDYELIFSDYFNNFIVSNCNEVKDVIDGVPNRHGVAHSWYRKYPNKKAALNAILLTDFIINLKPIEQAEEKENG